MSYIAVAKTEYHTTKTTEISSNPDIIAARSHHKPVSVLRRVGYWGATVLVGGVLLILAVVAFVVFLWSSRTDNYVWRKIVIAGWMTRAITLSALAIRWAVSAQAAVMAAMLAAVALYKSQVVLQDLAAVSVLRYNASGPHNLILPLLDSVRIKKTTLIWTLAAFASVTTVLLQFTSTVLLSDLRVGDIPGPEIIETINAGWGSTVRKDMTFEDDAMFEYLWRNPSIYPRIAEYRQSPQIQNNIYDTGPAYRALLPFQSVFDRNALRNYSGPSTVLDARTICIKPELSNVTMRFLTEWKSSESTYLLTVAGRIGFSSEAQVDPRVRIKDYQQVFNCTLPLPVRDTYDSGAKYDSDDLPKEYSSQSEWPFAICPLKSFYELGGPYDDAPLDIPIPVEEPYDTYGDWQSYLILNSTGSYASWEHNIVQARDDKDLAVFNISSIPSTQEDVEWAKYKVGRNNPSELGVSLCYYSHEHAEIMINGYSDTRNTEPEVGWNLDEQWYNTSAIGEAFGIKSAASPSKELNRSHMLTMDELQATDFNYTSTFGFTEIASIQSDDMIMNHNHSVFMCSRCFHKQWNIGMTSNINMTSNIRFIQEVNPIFVAIINEVLRNTRHPAIALQTFFTIYAIMPYYDQLPGFDESAEARYVLFIERLMPQNKLGLYAVLVVLALHLILLAVIVGLFLGTAVKGHAGFIGNSWLTIAQLAEDPRVTDWLGSSSAMSDQEVINYLKRRHLFDGKYE